jgi:hypothetical protein
MLGMFAFCSQQFQFDYRVRALFLPIALTVNIMVIKTVNRAE